MSNPIIEVSGLSKKYRIGTKVPYKTFREAIMNAITSPARLFSRNSSLLTPNTLNLKPDADTFWALKDVSFEVQEGEVLGMRKEEIKKKFDVSSDYLMIE